MKNIATVVIAFVLLSHLAIAGEIFKDEISDNTPFTIEGIEHIARYYSTAKKVSLKAGDDRVLISVADCEDIGDLKYCIDSATEGIDDETGDPSSTMELRVLQAGPNIEVDRDISTDDPALGEEVEVLVTLTNSGDEYAYNLNYEDSFPTGVKVTTSYKNPLKNGVLWAGNLAAGQSTSFSYKLTFNEFMDYESTGEASFLFKNKVNRIKSDTTTFSVETPFEISESISPKSADVNEEITYTININNTGDSQSITVENLEITIPSNAITSQRSLGLDVEQGKLKYSGTISSGDHETLSFKFKTSKITEGELTSKIKIKVGTQSFEEKFTHKVGFGISDIFPEITFNPKTVKGGVELEIEAKITNNGEDTISDISLDMAGDIIEPRGWRDLELAPDKKHFAYNKIISAPQVDAEKDFFIKLSGSYDKGDGKRMNFEKMMTITILPQEMLVELKPEVKKISDGEYNVTLQVKNLMTYKLSYISMIDTFPKGFRQTAGSRDIDIDELGIGEERLAYSYIVKVADDYTAKSFEITHIFSSLDDNEESVTNEKITKIELNTAENSNSDSPTNETSVNDTNNTASKDADTGSTEKKPGVFTRMWRWIKGLFSKDSVEEVPVETFE